MLKYKVIINMKLEEICMINIEKIDNIAASRKYPPTQEPIFLLLPQLEVVRQRFFLKGLQEK